MIDWEAFKRGEFAVRCDTEEKAKAFLRECANDGMHWTATGEPLKNYTRWEVNEKKTCYHANGKTYSISFDNESIFHWWGMLIIDYDQFVNVNNMVPDQTVKHDAGKPQLTLVPTGVIRAIAAVRAYGIQVRGGNDSWRSVDAVRLRDAAYRHWLAYLDEPDGVDADSGLPHLWHCVTNMAFLVEMGGQQDVKH